MKSYLFIIASEDDAPSTPINNETLFDDFGLAFDRLKTWVLHEHQKEVTEPKRPGPFNHTEGNLHYQIWETILPETN